MKEIIEQHKFKIATKKPYEIQSKLYLKNYSELNLFRQELEYSHNFYSGLSYSLARKKTLTYKSVFLGLGLLFIILGSFVYYTTLKFPNEIILSSTFEMAQHLIGGLSLLAGLGSLLICYSIRTESEIINHLLRRYYRQLSKSYARKQLQYKIRSFFLFGVSYRKQILLKHNYIDIKDQFIYLKEKTIELITYILNAKNVPPIKKDLLCNQTILELEEKLATLLDQFEQINLNEFEA